MMPVPRSPPAPVTTARASSQGRVAILASLLLVVGAGAAFLGVSAWRRRLARSNAGLAWAASQNGRVDFRLSAPEVKDDEIAFHYEAWHRGAAAADSTGTMQVYIAGRKVKMTLLGANGTAVRAYDGVVSADARSITGLSYALPNGRPSNGGTPWWATIDRTVVERPTRPSLNDATVGEIEAFLGRPSAAAWPIVERRFVIGPYTAAADLDGVKNVDGATLKQLKDGADAK